MRWRGIIVLGLVAAILAVYLQVRHHEFVSYDDVVYVVDNPLLGGGEPALERLRQAFLPYETNWIPLTWISLQIDHALYGFEPAGYLATNVSLHACNAVLLFLLLCRITGATFRSAFVAGVFALHPLHVESVAWVSERKDVLSGLFFLLGLAAWVRYAERPSAARYALVAGVFALGLLAKPMLVTFPAVLLLLDHWPFGRIQRLGWRRVVVEKLPLVALAAAVSVVTFVVQRDLGAMPSHPPDLWKRMLNAVHSYGFYVARSFWPTGLAVFYPYPRWVVSPAVAALEIAVLSAVSVTAVRWAIRRPYLLVGWLWFLGMLVPVIGLTQVGMQARADRYTYLPQIGLAIMLAWGAVDAARPWPRQRGTLLAAGAVALVALGWRSHDQVGYWRDTGSLFRRAVAVTEGNYLGHKVLAGEAWKAGRLDEAEAGYRESLRLKGDLAATHHELAGVLLESGDPAGAERHFRIAARSDAGHAQSRSQLGMLLLQAGRLEEALALLEAAVAIEPDPDDYARLAVAALGLGRDAEAVAYSREALARAPRDGSSANTLAWVLATSDDPAVRDSGEAVELAQSATGWEDGDRMLGTLAAALASAGRFEEAAATAERAEAYFAARGETGFAATARAHGARYRAGRAIGDPPPRP